jgi:hypothetical protein
MIANVHQNPFRIVRCLDALDARLRNPGTIPLTRSGSPYPTLGRTKDLLDSLGGSFELN